MHLDSLKLSDTLPTKVGFDLGSGLKLVVEPHAPGVFRVRVGKAESVAGDILPGTRAKVHADYLLARPEAVSEMQVEPLENTTTGWRLTQGEVSIELTSRPFSLTLNRQGNKVLTLSDAGIQYVDTAWYLGFDLEAQEKIFGLGESEGDLDRRNEVIVSDEPTHRALPLAWSTSGWGIYVNSLKRVEHDLGVDSSSVYQLSVEDETLDLFLFAGEPAEILNQYTQLTGRAGQPVLWSMGVWLEQAAGQTATQTAETIADFRKRKIAVDGVLMLTPAAWSYQDSKLTPDWDALRFPDAKQVLDLFAKRSIHLCLHTLPAVLVGSSLFEELEDRGWLLIKESGEANVFQGNAVTRGEPFALLDLTHKDVYNAWAERHRHLAEEGVGATACDVQFDIPDDVTARGGESGAALRALYPALARRALFEAAAGHKVPPEGVVFSNDLFPASQRLLWQQAPRVANDWSGLQHTLRTALSVGASGVPVQFHSIGNALAPLDNMTPELYLRWLGMAVLSGNFCFQGNEGLTPTSLDEQTQTIVQGWLQLRYRLIPYVLGAIEDAARTGLPVQRSMAMSFPSDAQAHRWDTQYLLGPAVLVAPAMQPGREIQVYLPKGEAWWDLNTGWRYEGGITLTMDCGLDTLPVFGREGHMLCLGPTAQHTGEFNSARILDEVWMFGMPIHNPVVMRNKIRVMQMQGSSYIKGLEGLRILPSEGLEVKRRGAEVRISRAR
ncbi:alpha-glucosidase (family GH31 glycosyl hydrolase) [Jezberella montanilacus]|uniref:Alpha-glucosidase (Family GH31 glycosyl hydrolase) n=1 Tax=Jezberella montanilacus TaxID=323426 RepID=A0A2T0XPE9_9BURK|nr:TIM-barrel domain-containing protein [Jezberella montanilacus]PRZ00752.1 alpha-glucosidase (family GH31 glycosyl hydrolase) [Jezberella montanilacus]